MGFIATNMCAIIPPATRVPTHATDTGCAVRRASIVEAEQMGMQTEWKTVMNENGLEVQTSKNPYNLQSATPLLRIRTILKGIDPRTVFLVIQDNDYRK